MLREMIVRFCPMQINLVQPFVQNLKRDYSDVRIEISETMCVVEIRFIGESASLKKAAKRLHGQFATYLFEGSDVASEVHRLLTMRDEKLALAESCTGGALAARLVAIPGSSHYLLGSIVAYSNAWKEQFLHVRHETLEKFGAVSKETVREMVEGLLSQTAADYAVALSGVAGPSGGSKQHPVGTVFIGIGEKNKTIDVGSIIAPPPRSSVIEYSVQFALAALWRRIAYQRATFS